MYQQQPQPYGQPQPQYGQQQPQYGQQQPQYGQPQPQYAQPQPQQYGAPQAAGVSLPPRWSSGLCSCMEDIGGCCFSAICPGCSIVKSRRKLANEEFGIGGCIVGLCMTIPLCACIYTMGTRTKIRDTWKFPEEGDCLKVCLCMPCAICQVGRELKEREKVGMLPGAMKM